MKRFIALAMCTTLLLATSMAQAPVTAPAVETPKSDTPAVAQPKIDSPTKGIKKTADGKLILEDSTPVRMRTNRNLSSADAKVGERLDLEVLDEVRIGDVVVIQQGALAFATVTEAQEKRRMGRAGKLNVNIDYVKLSNGDKAALRAVREAKGGGHVGAMTGAIVATSIVFFPAAPLFLFMHGKDIVIPKGTEITAYINGDTVIAPTKPTSPEPVVVAESSPELSVASTPDGADIEVDGAFAGNTPSKVGVARGDHTLTIRKSGYKAWERKVRVTSGSVNIKAELEAEPAEAPPQAK